MEKSEMMKRMKKDKGDIKMDTESGGLSWGGEGWKRKGI